MKDAKLVLTKLVNSFIGDQGDRVNFEFVEIEFAPNCYATFKLNNANMRALEKYAPDMYQLLSNCPVGSSMVFRRDEPAIRSDLDGIFSQDKRPNEL